MAYFMYFRPIAAGANFPVSMGLMKPLTEG